MKPSLLIFPLSIAAAVQAQSPKIDLSLQSRLGYDSNPIAVGGATAVLGDDSAMTYGLGASATAVWAEKKGAPPTLSLGYAADYTRFDTRSSENFSTHKLSLGSTLAGSDWKFVVDASSLLIAGNRATLTSYATGNANATALWRERRRQWQHRAKLQFREELGAYMVRATGTVLAYDYLTDVVSGRSCFANRSDIQAALEGGWKQSAASLWMAGVRLGHQNQATVPLPNSAFEYSNNYYRLTAGWEGKPWKDASLTFAAGPSFHHFDGAIDSRVFLGGRDRTSLWAEAALSAKLSPTVSLASKLTRLSWLSSTGKSAYLDTALDTTLSWTATPAWSFRVNGKVHRCDYYPAVRDDWESFVGAGLSWKLAPGRTLALDYFNHHGWNGLPASTERSFHRNVVTLGFSAQF